MCQENQTVISTLITVYFVCYSNYYDCEFFLASSFVILKYEGVESYSSALRPIIFGVYCFTHGIYKLNFYMVQYE